MSERPDKEVLNAIDALCDRFELAWRNDESPRILEYFQQWNGAHPELLLKHLLEIEIEFRRAAGEPLDVSYYEASFPEHAEVLAQLLAGEEPLQVTIRQRLTEFSPDDYPTDDQFADATTTQNHLRSIPRTRFAPGKIIANRYRVVAPLGQGGMGEVYRADDLKLGQQVALKFLPADVSSENERLLEYFHNEVRLARQITHPNVCRVFDIDDAAGVHFLSMEYIDGENLAGLLRRIGSLPEAKAIEVAWQICAGLQAAHRNGVLHRDLKPANVMLDSRGRAKIADFGLARLSDRTQHGEGLVGTPAYMAPEQYQQQVTNERTDIYALGLVLYELFVGSPARDVSSRVKLTDWFDNPHSIDPAKTAHNLNPQIAAAIRQCLELAPEDRPSSVAEVAAALPGSDELSAMLAAGDTPSPEMVAAAAPATEFSPTAIHISAAICVVLLGCAVSLSTLMYRKLGLSEPIAVLVDQAREMTQTLQGRQSEHEAYGFAADREFLRKLNRVGLPWDLLSDQDPTPLYFWYRAQPNRLISRAPDWSGEQFLRIDERRPPLTAGASLMRLTPDGRLLYFESVPGVGDPAASTETTEFDSYVSWLQPTSDPSRLRANLSAAGLALRSETQHDGSGLRLFQVEVGGTTAGDAGSSAPALAEGLPLRSLLMLVWIPSLLVAGAFLAVRNLRRGRADRDGAFRVAGFLFVAGLFSWFLTSSHVLAAEQLDQFLTALAGTLLLSSCVWLSYVAIEPVVRREWPRTLVSWSRVLNGRFADAEVGTDLVFGVTAGALATCFKMLIALIPLQLGLPADAFPGFMNLSALAGGRIAFGEVGASLTLATLYGIFNQLLFLMILLVVLRRRWLAGAAYVLFMSLLVASQFQPFSLAFLLTAVEMTVTVVLFIRMGLLAVVAMHFARLLLKFPVTWDAEAWYADSGFLALLVIGLTLGWGYWKAATGRVSSRR